jgi:hypothetical protein
VTFKEGNDNPSSSGAGTKTHPLLRPTNQQVREELRVTKAQDTRQQDLGDARLLAEARHRIGAACSTMADGIFVAVGAYGHDVEQADDIACFAIARPAACDNFRR